MEGGIEFTYTDPNAGSVTLAGIFNSWSMNANPLAMDEDGVWRVVMALGPGTYEYKFVVNGSEWVADPENPRVVGVVRELRDHDRRERRARGSAGPPAASRTRPRTPA